MSTEENKTLIRRLYDAFGTERFMAVIDELVAPDVVYHHTPPGLLVGIAGYRQLIGVYAAAFPDTQITIEEQIAEGDKVVRRWTGRGTHRGELMGIAPTGKAVTLTGITIIRVAAGKIAEEWEENDALGMM